MYEEIYSKVFGKTRETERARLEHILKLTVYAAALQKVAKVIPRDTWKPERMHFLDPNKWLETIWAFLDEKVGNRTRMPEEEHEFTSSQLASLMLEWHRQEEMQESEQ